MEPARESLVRLAAGDGLQGFRQAEELADKVDREMQRQVPPVGNGSMTAISYPGYGALPGTTFVGTTFSLSPGELPTTVDTIIASGTKRIYISTPLEPADGTIGGCE